jgi:hypothetical protein
VHFIKAEDASSYPDISELNFTELKHHLWSEKYPDFYSSRVAVCGIAEKGILVCFEADEPSPRAVFENRDDPVYNDSCMEFFFQPFADDERYINFEINPNGAYLSAVGYDRNGRAFLRKISGCAPCVKACISDSGWSAELFVPEQLISDVFGRKYSVTEAEYIRANFYKCGDLTPLPHYASLFPVNTPEPDYHRPEFFGKIFFDKK